MLSSVKKSELEKGNEICGAKGGAGGDEMMVGPALLHSAGCYLVMVSNLHQPSQARIIIIIAHFADEETGSEH